MHWQEATNKSPKKQAIRVNQYGDVYVIFDDGRALKTNVRNNKFEDVNNSSELVGFDDWKPTRCPNY